MRDDLHPGTGVATVVVALLVASLAGVLGGCASSALDLAPASSNTPFKPMPVSGEPAPAQATMTDSGSKDYSLPPATGLALAESGVGLDVGHVYDLAELIDVAQTSNPQTRTAWEAARRAALDVGITKALYLPVVTATVVGGYQHFSNSGQIADLSSSTVGDLHGTVSGVALQWLLFDFGERDALTRAAKDRSFASNIAFNGTHQRIIYDVSRAFYEYSSARQKLAIARQSKVESSRLRDAAHAKLAQGVGTTVETAQADQLYVQAAFDEVQAEGGERDSYHALLAAVGISATAKVAVKDVSNRPLEVALVKPVEEMLDAAIASRPDIQVGLANARAAREGVIAARADFLPKVFLSTSGTFLSGNLNVTSLPSLGSITQGTSSNGALSTSTSQNNATVLGGVSIPIYDGGVRDARVLLERSRVEGADADLMRLQQSAASEIVSAADAVRTSVAAYRAATALVQASAVTKDATLSSYKSGLGTITAALDAQRALLSARLAQAQAHGTALIAASSFAFLTGLSSSDPQTQRTLLTGPLR